ncbi:trypsin-like serine protease [Streptomyces netropsis]
MHFHGRLGSAAAAVTTIGLAFLGTSTIPAHAISGGVAVSERDANLVRVILGSSCTGSVIGKNHILTAAHCVPDRDAARMYGRVSRADGYSSEMYRVTYPADGADMAVITVDDVPAGPTGYRKLLNQAPSVGDEIKTYGYGEADNLPQPRVAQANVIPPYPSPRGWNVSLWFKGVDGYVVPGDSGGPETKVVNGVEYQVGELSALGPYNGEGGGVSVQSEWDFLSYYANRG